MFLFVIAAPVLAAAFSILAITPLFGPVPDVGSPEIRARAVRTPALVALAAGVILVLYSLAFVTWAPWTYTPLGLFIHHLFRDHVVIVAVIAAGSFLAGRTNRDAGTAELHATHVAFVATAVGVMAVFNAIQTPGWISLYMGALLPLVRAAVVIVLPVAMTVADTARGGGWAVVTIVALPFLGAVPAMFAEWLRPVPAIATALMVAALAAAAVVVFAVRPSNHRRRGPERIRVSG